MQLKKSAIVATVISLGLLSVFVLSLTFAKVDQTSVQMACNANTSTGFYDKNSTLALYEGAKVNVPPEIRTGLAGNNKANILGVATPDEKWIEVSLSTQTMRAWNGNTLFLESKVSSGLSGFNTPKGEFNIWYKIKYTRMSGGSGSYAYDLPNVPYTMFFEGEGVPASKGYGLHGTYWHNDFGKQHSHGCVNLPTPVAQQLYDWTTPIVPAGQNLVKATDENPGTRIIIHD